MEGMLYEILGWIRSAGECYPYFCIRFLYNYRGKYSGPTIFVGNSHCYQYLQIIKFVDRPVQKYQKCLSEGSGQSSEAQGGHRWPQKISQK